MCLNNLTIVVFHQVSAVTVQHTRFAGTQRCRMAAAVDTISATFNTIHGYAVIIQEWIKQSNGVGSSTDTGD